MTLYAGRWGSLEVVGLLAASATLAGFLSWAGWPIELAAHFRVQYLVVLASLAAASAIGRRYWVALTLACLAAVNGIVISLAYARAVIVTDARRAPLRLMLMNVHAANQAHDEVLRAVRESSPHVIVFEEVNQRWLAHLHILSSDFPSSVIETREDDFGIALFSRLPVQDARIVYIGLSGVPSVTARVSFEGTAVTLLGTHTLPPGNSLYASLRDDQLRAVPGFLAQLPRPHVVLGDLNTSPWSYEFHRLLDSAGLRDSRRGHGLQPTWPTTFWPLLVPIDHCLHSPDLTVSSRKTGASVGSDHYPVIVDLVAAEPGGRGAIRPDRGTDRPPPGGDPRSSAPFGRPLNARSLERTRHVHHGSTCIRSGRGDSLRGAPSIYPRALCR